MILLVGLGNPGQKYAANRHNIGFMAVDEIVHRFAFSGWRQKFNAEICEGFIDLPSKGREKVALMKPTTFMNNSGQAVGEAMRFYKLTPNDIYVFHDELDLPAGKIRVKKGGGHGGHNGLRSIDAHINKDYWRIRMGIGHPGHKDRVHGWVLSDFSKNEQNWLDPLLDEIARNSGYLVEGRADQFMNQIAMAVKA